MTFCSLQNMMDLWWERSDVLYSKDQYVNSCIVWLKIFIRCHVQNPSLSLPVLFHACIRSDVISKFDSLLELHSTCEAMVLTSFGIFIIFQILYDYNLHVIFYLSSDDYNLHVTLCIGLYICRLQQHNMTTKDAYQYFVLKAQEIAISKNWTPVNWYV